MAKISFCLGEMLSAFSLTDSLICRLMRFLSTALLKFLLLTVTVYIYDASGCPVDIHIYAIFTGNTKIVLPSVKILSIIILLLSLRSIDEFPEYVLKIRYCSDMYPIATKAQKHKETQILNI